MASTSIALLVFWIWLNPVTASTKEYQMDPAHWDRTSVAFLQ